MEGDNECQSGLLKNFRKRSVEGVIFRKSQLYQLFKKTTDIRLVGKVFPSQTLPDGIPDGHRSNFLHFLVTG